MTRDASSSRSGRNSARGTFTTVMRQAVAPLRHATFGFVRWSEPDGPPVDERRPEPIDVWRSTGASG